MSPRVLIILIKNIEISWENSNYRIISEGFAAYWTRAVQLEPGNDTLSMVHVVADQFSYGFG